MSKIGIFMADGCEEIEGLAVVDIMRRVGIEITMISVSDNREVTGSHKITFCTDALKSEVSFEELDGIVLPGGMPGTLKLGEDETVTKTVRDFAAAGKMVAAICAAPSVLGQAGVLQGKNATCHPGFEEKLLGATCSAQPVGRDKNVITSRGMGTAIPFALEIVRYFLGDEAIDKVCAALVY